MVIVVLKSFACMFSHVASSCSVAVSQSNASPGEMAAARWEKRQRAPHAWRGRSGRLRGGGDRGWAAMPAGCGTCHQPLQAFSVDHNPMSRHLPVCGEWGDFIWETSRE
eukprot:gene16289-biopygen14320